MIAFAVQEWRSRWFLEKRWESSSCEELLNGMNDINDHVRLSAVSACSKALLSKKITETNAKERSKQFFSSATNPLSFLSILVIVGIVYSIFSCWNFFHQPWTNFSDKSYLAVVTIFNKLARVIMATK